MELHMNCVNIVHLKVLAIASAHLKNIQSKLISQIEDFFYIIPTQIKTNDV